MEVSALTYSTAVGVHARSPLLRLQSDDRLITLIRRGNASAFEVLVSRYQVRLLAFCRHLVRSQEDAEDVLQEVLAAAFNAIQADSRPINVRPWLYRIARNRCLNHLRRAQPIGVDSMDVHLSEHGASTADKVHAREIFRHLVDDIQRLPETQKSALVLREMDALSYEQIAEAMETTVPSVKSLLVRARVSLAEAAEARQLSCPEVRLQLAEVAEGLSRKPGALVRRHLRSCGRCASFERQLKRTNKSLAALLPIGGMSLIRKLALFHAGHTAGTGSGATGTAGVSGATAGGGATAGTATGVTASTASGVTAGGVTAGGVTAGTTGGMTAGGMAVGGVTAGAGGATGVTAGAMGGLSAGGSLLSAGAGAIATKAAAGLAVATLVTAGAIATTHSQHPTRQASVTPPKAAPAHPASSPATSKLTHAPVAAPKASAPVATTPAPAPPTSATATTTTPTATAPVTTTTTPATTTTATTSEHSQTASDATVPPAQTSSAPVVDPAAGSGSTSGPGTTQDADTGSTGSTGSTGTTGDTGPTGTDSGSGDPSGGTSPSGPGDGSDGQSTGSTGSTGSDGQSSISDPSTSSPSATAQLSPAP
jgi:RNA polymerase sigma factor (sigma-70 family)